LKQHPFSLEEPSTTSGFTEKDIAESLIATH